MTEGLKREPLENTSFMFGGGLYAWPYHAGVASYLQEHGLVHDEARLYGVSSGTVPAVLLACGVNIKLVGLLAAMRCNDAHANARVGPFLNPQKVQQTFDMFARVLPDDAHLRASGRLHIVVTELPTMRLRVLSRFPTRDALCDALKASMSIPGHGVPLAYRAQHLERRMFVDGGFVRNVIDDNRAGFHTIRVGVFDFHSIFNPRPCELHIRPKVRVPWRMRLGVQSDHVRHTWHRRGYDDAHHYFAKRAGHGQARHH